MKNILLALVVLLSTMWISNSSFARETGADGYRFSTKSIERKEVRIKIVTYKTSEALEKALKSHLGNDPKYSAIKASRVEAFSILELPEYNVCTIHMIDPEVSYEPEYVGHEMLHCIYGQWHK